MIAEQQPNVPEPGKDSTVEDWFGQSVERDTEIAEKLSEQMPPEEAEKAFDEQATGESEQKARRGPRIDPEQGESAYRHSDD